MSVRRVPSDRTATEVGVDQVNQLCRQRADKMEETLYLIVGDGKYGNHHFLAPWSACAVTACSMERPAPTAA